MEQVNSYQDVFLGKPCIDDELAIFFQQKVVACVLILEPTKQTQIANQSLTFILQHSSLYGVLIKKCKKFKEVVWKVLIHFVCVLPGFGPSKSRFLEPNKCLKYSPSSLNTSHIRFSMLLNNFLLYLLQKL